MKSYFSVLLNPFDILVPLAGQKTQPFYEFLCFFCFSIPLLSFIFDAAVPSAGQKGSTDMRSIA